MDSWQAVEGMINVVRRTGHSSFYVEMGMGAMGKTAKQMNLQGELRVNGGAFPVWLEVDFSWYSVWKSESNNCEECTLQPDCSHCVL